MKLVDEDRDMSTRTEKVNSIIQRLVAQYIQAERFDGITGLVTVTEVDSTPDLEHAKVYFSVVGQSEDEVLEVLKQNIYDIQGMLYEKLEMKKVPRISFVPDTSGQYADRIGKLIKKLKPSPRRSTGAPPPDYWRGEQ